MSVYGPRSELDLVAVQRDDEALDELARRETRDPMSQGVLLLLAALATDVDDGLKELLAAPMRLPLRSAATDEIPSLAAARRRTARTLTGALIVAGLVSVSGVSAAVTGDPFTPYRSVISSVSDDDRARATKAAEDEVVRQQFLSIDAAIESGQLDRARVAIQRLHATLDQKPRGTQLAAIATLSALEAKLARAVAQDSKKADDTRPPPTPVLTGDGSVPSTQVKKPVDKPKPTAKPEKAPSQGGSEKSAATTTQPRQKDIEEPAAAKTVAGSDAGRP